jgi:hypothetical protein
MAQGLPPRVWWEGADRDELISIRKGSANSDEVLKQFDEIEADTNKLMTKLPKETDVPTLNRFLVEWRLKGLSRPVPLLKVSRDNKKLKEEAENLLKKHLKGTFDLVCVVPIGSLVYETVEEGDKVEPDYLVIYVSPIEEVVSIGFDPKKIYNSGVESEKFNFARG